MPWSRPWPPSSTPSTPPATTAWWPSGGRWRRTWPPATPIAEPTAEVSADPGPALHHIGDEGGHTRSVKVALVLGAGGMVGMAYHAGALRALEEEGGFSPAQADLIVGTSSGSVLGAYLRSGWSTTDFWDLALGAHPTLESLAGLGESAAAPLAEELPRAFAPAFHTPLDLARRFLGSAYVMTRSVVRLPTPGLPGSLGHAFPAGP